MSVIKKIGKKVSTIQSDAFPSNSFVPIGTDGMYVDMLSRLDLQEELKIGGSKSVVIGNNYQTTEEDGKILKYVSITQTYDKHILKVQIYEGQDGNDLSDDQNNSIVNDPTPNNETPQQQDDDENIYTNLRPYKIIQYLYEKPINENDQPKLLHSKIIQFGGTVSDDYESITQTVY